VSVLRFHCMGCGADFVLRKEDVLRCCRCGECNDIIARQTNEGQIGFTFK